MAQPARPPALHRLGTTDAEGRFGCELPRAMFEGAWEIEVWEPGYAPARIPLRDLWCGSPTVPVRAWLAPDALQLN